MSLQSDHIYQQDPKYKDQVAQLFSQTTFPSIVEGVAPITPRRYHHIGLICRNIPQCCEFYAKLGWSVILDQPGSVVRLRHPNTLELHLIQADDTARGEADNILMDTPQLKHPGHTHASWSVPSVPSVKSFFSALV